MRCPRCKKGSLRQHVNVFVEAPADCRNLSKQGIRSASVRVMGVGWDRAVIFCDNPLCGNVKRSAPASPSEHGGATREET